MSSHTIAEIAHALNATFDGDGTLAVHGAAEPATATSDQLAVAMSASYAEALKAGQARTAILWEGADWQSYGLKAAIFVNRPRMAMSHLTRHLYQAPKVADGIHPTAVIDPTATLGAGVSIGAFSVVAAGAQIGEGAVIANHCTIGENAEIGAGAILRSGVRLEHNIRIGDRFFAHPGVVVGSDGFSFVTEEMSAVEKVREEMESVSGVKSDQTWEKIYSLGGVEIGDDVEIGANTVIDAGTIRATKIGSGTKIDALAQMGHNVVIGTNCLLCGHVAVAGSSVVGNNVVLGGQVGVADNITIGDGVVAGGASKIYSNVPAGRAVLGSPAVKMETHIETYKALRRLPRLIEQVRKIHERVSKLDESH